MATTNLIVDFLVIGLVSSIWLAPLALLGFDSRTIKAFFEAGPAAIPFLLGFAYILGISISRLADDLTDTWNDRWRDEVFGTRPGVSYHSQMNLVIAESDSASQYLGYRRSVIRTARACAVNFLLGSIFWLVLAFLDPGAIPLRVAIGISVTTALIAVLLLRAWRIVLQGYFHGIRDLYNYLRPAIDRTENGNGEQ